MTTKARIVVASVIFIGLLFGAVYPTRTYLRQQRELRAAEHRLDLFREQNGRLEGEVKRLESDEEIERMARARFNLVKPGEEAYAIVPVPPPAAPPTGAAGASPAPGAPARPAAPPSAAVGPDDDDDGPAVFEWMAAALQRVF